MANSSPPLSSPPLSSSATAGGGNNPFRRLVRSLSRSGRGTNSSSDDTLNTSASATGAGKPAVSPGTSQSTTLDAVPLRTSSKSRRAQPANNNDNNNAYANLSTSPPPDSYFPKPSRATLQDGEANGRARHPDSHGQRATDAGEQSTGQAAPGVTFAPSRPDIGRSSSAHASQNNGNARLPESELDSWNPPPRRSASQRVAGSGSNAAGTAGGGVGRRESKRDKDRNNRGDVEATSGAPTGLNRARAGSAAAARNGKDDGLVAGGLGSPFGDDKKVASPDTSDDTPLPVLLTDSNGTGGTERRGVQLEDKPLSRKTSVKRAASAVKRALTIPAPPLVDRMDGEIRVLVLVADGSEEIETIAAIDVCVRAGLTCTVVSVSPQFSPSQSLPYVTLSRGAKLMADTQFEGLKQEHKDDFDALIIPGGAKGAERLSQDVSVQRLVRAFHEQGKTIGMICAGVLAAKTSGIALGQRLTSHPSVKGELEKHYRYSEDRVVVSGNLITSRGPGTAIEWALTIVGILAGQDKRDEVAGPMML